VEPVDRRDDGGREAAERFESDEAISSSTISFSLLALDYCDSVGLLLCPAQRVMSREAVYAQHSCLMTRRRARCRSS
jgi:hypothetical protein